MGKSRFALETDEEIDDFGRRFISEGFVWRTLNKGENPFSPCINPIKYPIYISFFMEGGLFYCSPFYW